MTPELEKRLREAGTDFIEVWPGSEIWAPRSRADDIKAAVLAGLEGLLVDVTNEARAAGAGIDVEQPPLDLTRDDLTTSAREERDILDYPGFSASR